MTSPSYATMRPRAPRAAPPFRAAAGLALALGLLAGASGLRAQIPASTLRGMVLDTAGKPVSGQSLTLHRVDERTGGAMVDSARSDAQGRFSMNIKAESDTAAVYFVATRWQGQLYIGQPFRPPAPTPYVVTVGVNPVNMGAAPGGGAAGGMGGAPQGMGGTGAEPQPQPPPSGNNGRWFLAGLLGLVALVALAYGLLGDLRERGARRRREVLAQIAQLDERALAAPPGERAALERERADLLAQLPGE